MRDVHGRDLDLNLLKVFAVVADEGSITRAASRLYVTQPAVSAAMRRLTAFVGVDLFARQGRGVVLTSRGVELAAAARAYLAPLVAATMAVPLFQPAASTATVRLGLSDAMESVLLPPLLARLRAEAPAMTVIVLPVQFRTVEESLLSSRVDLAITVADELPRSILRQRLVMPPHVAGGFVCLHDPRFSKLKARLSEREYFAHEHVAVSYAGDVRGIIEDALGKSRAVRVSVPSFSYVADVVDGSPLLATLPSMVARHIVKIRPHLRCVPLPFALEGAGLDLLWLRATDGDPAASFVRGLVMKAALAVEAAPARRAKAR
jgi:LysR family transcriptional activator of mexEF-oprN operon